MVVKRCICPATTQRVSRNIEGTIDHVVRLELAGVAKQMPERRRQVAVTAKSAPAVEMLLGGDKWSI